MEAPLGEALDPAIRSETMSRLIIEIAAAASRASATSTRSCTRPSTGALRGVVRLTGGSIALVDGDELVDPGGDRPVRQGRPRPAPEARSRPELGRRRDARAVSRGDMFRDGDTGRRGQAGKRDPLVAGGADRPERNVGIGLVEIDSTEVDAFSDRRRDAARDGRRRAGRARSRWRRITTRKVRAAALRDAFIGVIGHELRTPVTTITASPGSSVGAGPGSITGRRDQGDRSTSRSEADRLPDSIEDLLVLSRVEAGQASRSTAEPINWPGLVRHIVETERDSASEPRVPVRGGAGPAARRRRGDVRRAGGPEPAVERREVQSDRAADRDRARRGATTASSSGCSTRHRGGPGADAARAFELFFRTRDATPWPSGAGIGLFVCRQLVEAMGGRIWMTPGSGGGAEVGFGLPATEPDELDEA